MSSKKKVKKVKKIKKLSKLSKSKKLNNLNKFIAKVAIHHIFKNDSEESQQIVNQSRSKITKLLNKILKH